MAYKLVKCPKNNAFAFASDTIPFVSDKEEYILGNVREQHKTTYPITSTVKM